MARELSPFIQGLFNAAAITGERVWNSHVALDITLNTGAHYKIATGEITMNSISRSGASITLGSPMVFEARAFTPPALRHSQGAAPDAGELALINLDYVVSQLIPETSRLVENASVNVYICFPKADGNYEGMLYFVGLLKSVSGDDEFAKLSLISDLSDFKAQVAEEITQRCLNTLGDAKCGATHLPGGATCSKEFDDIVNGCKFWGMMHAFWGIPFINPTGLIDGYAGANPGSGGWSEGPPGCVDPYSFIKRASGLWTRGTELEKGDQTIDLRGRIGTIEQIDYVYAEHRYLIEGSNRAKLRCGANHPLTTAMDDFDGRQAYTFRPYVDFLNEEISEPHRILSESDSKIELLEQWNMLPLAGGRLLKLSMAEGGSRNYVAGVEPGYGFDGHNVKPVYYQAQFL